MPNVPNVSCVLLQNATERHAYLNSFSTAPQSAKYGINQFSDLSQKEFRGRLTFCHILRFCRIGLGTCTVSLFIESAGQLWLLHNWRYFIRWNVFIYFISVQWIVLNSLSILPAESAQSLFTCIIVFRNDFELHLLSTDLYLRASADRAPLFSGLKTTGLPAKFDWRDKAVVAPVQNQQAVRFTQRDDKYSAR